MLGEKTTSRWALLVGTLAAPIAGALLLPLVFGTNPVDAASAWGLAGAAHVIIAVLCVPAFWIAYALSLSLLRLRLPLPEHHTTRRWSAVILALLAYGAVSMVVLACPFSPALLSVLFFRLVVAAITPRRPSSLVVYRMGSRGQDEPRRKKDKSAPPLTCSSNGSFAVPAYAAQPQWAYLVAPYRDHQDPNSVPCSK